MIDRENPPGPAPEDASSAAESLDATVTATDGRGAERLDARFQPWAAGGGGCFVAWRIGEETGHLGTFAFPEYGAFPDDPPGESDAVVWLGERGYPTGGGRYRGWVGFGPDEAELLRDGIRKCRLHTQSPSAGLAPLSAVDPDHASVTAERADRLADPTPEDAATTGGRHAYRVHWWGPVTVGCCRAWRPEDSAAVYVAWGVAPPILDGVEQWDTITYGGTLDRGTHGILGSQAPSLRLGRRRSTGWVYFFHPDTADAFDALVEDVRELRDGGPDDGFVTVRD